MRNAAGDASGCATLARRAVRRAGWLRRLYGRTDRLVVDGAWKDAVERLNTCDPGRALDLVEQTELAFGATWRATLLAKGGRLDEAVRVIETAQGDGRAEDAWVAIALGAIAARREELATRAAARLPCQPMVAGVLRAAGEASAGELARALYERCAATPWVAEEQARILARSGRLEEAKALGTRYPIGDVVAWELFQATLGRKEVDAARAIASELNFRRQDAALALVRAYVEAGRLSEAEACLLRVEELWAPLPGPRWVDAAIVVAAALRRAGEGTRSEALARDLAAVANDPGVGLAREARETMSVGWARRAVDAGAPDLMVGIWEGRPAGTARTALGDLAILLDGSATGQPKALVDRIMEKARALGQARPFTAEERAGELAAALARAGFVDEAFEVTALIEGPRARGWPLLSIGSWLHFKGGEGAEARGAQLLADGRFD
jgi:hypothetical protein